MMTSRAEYRLLLRQDNADLRLRKIGYEVGLISREAYDFVCEKEKMIEAEITRLQNKKVGANKEIQEFLESKKSSGLKTAASLAELISRPELSYEAIAKIDPDRPKLSDAVIEQININLKYDGYIKRQKKQVEQFKKLERKKIPSDIDYSAIKNLRIEARQKLQKFKPISVGQASRISGVSPADISVLMIYLNV